MQEKRTYPCQRTRKRNFGRPLLPGCVSEGRRPMMRSMKYSTVSEDGQSGRAQYAESASPTVLWRPFPVSKRVRQRECNREGGVE